MTGILDSDAIDALLRGEMIAHLACIKPDGRPYVVPITYAYDGKAMYSYSADGEKLEALRANPSACVVVDRVGDAANWVSVIAWGTFHELADEEAAEALRLISARLRTVALADAAWPLAERTYVARIGRDGVVYRITIAERTGRYSSSGA
jgi:nitroimidazol reductase NimA-like FMN-containing flavoprotein (pyridoxamine 5'-phosphate oxidase superfamily)